jgi:hypothetical protein
MNWESFEGYQTLRTEYKFLEFVARGGQGTNPASEFRRMYADRRERRKPDFWLSSKKAAENLHPRRTLDQFYYSSLRDTETRDAGQTISKWTGKGLPEGGRSGAVDDSLLVMVDQLWCWVLDESQWFIVCKRPLPRTNTTMEPPNQGRFCLSSLREAFNTRMHLLPTSTRASPRAGSVARQCGTCTLSWSRKPLPSYSDRTTSVSSISSRPTAG